MSDADAPLVFVDTNVLVYAHDTSAGHRRDLARARVRSLFLERRGVVSIQVLQELYQTLTRKIPKPIGKDQAAELIEDYGRWRLVTPGLDLLTQAIALERREQLSFWDAMIVAAAARGGCQVLLSEDMGHARRFDGVVVENPFS